MLAAEPIKPWLIDQHIRPLAIWCFALLVVFVCLTLLVLFAWFIPLDRDWAQWQKPRSGCRVEELYELSKVCSRTRCEFQCSPSECVKVCTTTNYACSSIEARVSFRQDKQNRTSIFDGPQNESNYAKIMNFRLAYPVGTVFPCYYQADDPNTVVSKRTGADPYNSMIVVILFSLISAALFVSLFVFWLRHRTLNERRSFRQERYDVLN